MSLSDWPGFTRFLRCRRAYCTLIHRPNVGPGRLCQQFFARFFATCKLFCEPAGIGVNRAFATHAKEAFSTALSTALSIRWTT